MNALQLFLETQELPYAIERVAACWIACKDCGENELIETDQRAAWWAAHIEECCG